MAEYALDQQLISAALASLPRPRRLFLAASLLFSCQTALFGVDGADTAATLHYSQVREQHGTALAAHRPWAWEVETSRGKIWVLGCLHLGSPRDTVVFPAYSPAYRSAATVYFETMPGAWSGYETKEFMDRRGFLHDRQTLSGKVSRQTWQVLSSALAERPGKLAAISSMEPWLAAFSLVQEDYANTGLRVEDGLEAYFERSAIEDRKPIGALETPKEQILAMADATPAAQEEFLRDTAAGLPNLPAQTQAIRDAWLSGDESRLQTALGLSATSVRPGIQQNLIDARNRRWVRKVQEIADHGKNAVIIVGVEHLVSLPYALPDLLTQAGLAAHRTDPRSKANARPPESPGTNSMPIPYPFRGQQAR